MTESEKNIYNNILEKIHFDEEFDFQKLSRVEAYKEVEGYLNLIVDSFGCHDYLFELAVTRMYEKHGLELLPYLYSILDYYCIHQSHNGGYKSNMFPLYFLTISVTWFLLCVRP